MQRTALQRWMQEHARLLNRGAVIGMIVAVAVIVWVLPVRELGRLLQIWTDQLGPWGYVMYAGAYLVMSVLSIPVWTMPFIAGAAFGPVWGTVLASASCVVSAAVCFAIARTLRGTWLATWADASPRMQALERVVEAGNWKIVAAVRFSHFLTFGLQNYTFGLAKVDFRTYLIATWLATLPGTTLQVYVGHLGFTSIDAWQAQSVEWKGWVLRVGGLLAMALAVGYLGSVGRRVYRDTLARPLAETLKSGTAANNAHWPWSTVILTTCCLLLIGTATWCALHREELRESIQQWNTAHVSQRNLVGMVSP